MQTATDQMCSPKCKKYKDVLAAPGSELYKATEDGDKKKAEEAYNQAKAAAKDL